MLMITMRCYWHMTSDSRGLRRSQTFISNHLIGGLFFRIETEGSLSRTRQMNLAKSLGGSLVLCFMF